jgi:hypothetical protein
MFDTLHIIVTEYSASNNQVSSYRHQPAWKQTEESLCP